MDSKIAVARCHEIQLATRDKDISRFESIPEIGMAVQFALHIRGLAAIDYDQAKFVAAALLGIPRLAFDRIASLLAEIEFIRIGGGHTVPRIILPTVPFFDDLYEGLGGYFDTLKLDEFEGLTLEIVDRLASSPYNADALAGQLGAERKAFDDSVEIGTKGGFLVSRRARAKSVLLNPSYFSENAELFADHVASVGAKSVNATLKLLRRAQGWPVQLIEKTGEIAGTRVDADGIKLLKRLAQDGMVKPPSITTTHAGTSVFLFTPTPGVANITPFKREIYERALAVVSAVRQGQLLPNNFRIRSPGAVLYTLSRDLQLRPTSDYSEQYQGLVHYRVARLEKLANGYFQLKVIDTPENREALKIAYDLVTGGSAPDLSVDNEAVSAMSGSREYVESLLSSKLLREKELVKLSSDDAFEIEQLILGF
ncbi:hypothetical protein AB7849_18045 [Rhodanobacter sp. 115]|uniref:hypothetical protein n=1 Tax=Rhodanobacter sp. FW021-MT20 TaxID=1162282 RepID=UPI0002DD45E0|nr:hypothetical protein [Rhodanobacter sp. 115]